MKTALIFFSISLFLLQGCYSYYPLVIEDKVEGRPAEVESILILLNNGTSIEVEPYHHVQVTEPSDFVFGIGEKEQRTGKVFVDSQGRNIASQVFLKEIQRIQRVEIDSSGYVWKYREAPSEKRLFVCWLKDGSSVSFEGVDYVDVRADSGVGMWCVGVLQPASSTGLYSNSSAYFRGRVIPNQIKEIQVRKLSTSKTVLFVVVTAFAVSWVVGTLIVHINLGWK